MSGYPKTAMAVSTNQSVIPVRSRSHIQDTEFTQTESDNALVEETSSHGDIVQPGWLERTLDILHLSNYKSVVLENKGAVARDHLANERTFLAWNRTSLAFSSIGVGITQLFRLVKENKEQLRKAGNGIGGCFVIASIIVLILGTSRYFSTQKLLQKDKMPASRASIIFVFSISFILVLVTFALLIIIE